MQVVNKYDRSRKTTTNDVNIMRPTIFGNPFSHMANTVAQYRVATRDEAINAYRQWLGKEIKEVRNTELIAALRAIPDDATLVCCCKPLGCHGDVIIDACKWLKVHPEY